MTDTGGGDQPPVEERTTVFVKEAAQLLGRSERRVHQLLDSPKDPLDGPGPPGRGRNHRTRVYLDTIEPQRVRQQNYGRSRATDSRRHTQSDRSAQPGVASDLGPSTQDLVWALQQLNAATDALHDAAQREAAVREHYRDALTSLAKALAEHEEVAAAIRRSDRLRSEVLGVFLTPNDPGGL